MSISICRLTVKSNADPPPPPTAVPRPLRGRTFFLQNNPASGCSQQFQLLHALLDCKFRLVTVQGNKSRPLLSAPYCPPPWGRGTAKRWWGASFFLYPKYSCISLAFSVCKASILFCMVNFDLSARATKSANWLWRAMGGINMSNFPS